MQRNTKRLITISMLGAIGFILMWIRIPIPFLPPYLTLDFGDVPALLATFSLGPLAGIAVEAIKIILHLLFNLSEPVGPLANFFAATSFLLTAFFVSRHRDTLKSLIIGLVCGTIVMTIVLSILNYFVLLPLYGMIVQLDDIGKNLKIIIISGIIPFNIIKGVAISIVFLLLYKRLKRVIKQ
ncbi:ECF transporter S component [Staphylococcus sp. SQ8-PEA]|uniref:Riboflavin transporter n=1 Tax=Staphylococcus marylandisciuri TaxID=2981529 RepID=A0ABT2QNC2_9STAP|nr:ECF transporter S component [Staphylococcus marylandisciuri]MCU5745467.1 ECF transporter S component [Staphylococcus marylandisciuri]